MKIIYLRCPKLLGGCTSSITMRPVLFFLLNAMFNASASSFAQKLTIEERNVPLESLLKKIRLQSGYDFFYNADLIKTSKPVTINVKNASIEDVLRISFEDQPLTYTLTAKTVIIRKSKELSLPPVEIRGRVIDNSGLPLPGVSIRVKGSTMGTSTNLNGEFVLPNVPDNATLQISFIGYTSKEVAVKRNIGTIKLELADSKLNEVVVVGYGSVKKSDVTGSIASIKPNENDASKAVSVDNLLQGKIPGVSVSGSVATPGAASSVTIRGANSLRGDNQPLYVIDNIPQASTGEFAASAFGGSDFQIAQNPLTNLNPSDIADIQILKDASATAIYGSRGANGVIIITTKRGKAGAARVSANANYTVVQATNYRNMMNLREYAAYRNEKTGPAGTQYFQVGDETRYIFSGGVYNAEDPATYRILNEKNWQKEIYRNALSQNYDLTVSGGSKGIKYYLSTDFKIINGMVKETGLRQGGLRLNLNGDISKSLSFNASMSGSMKKNNMMSV